MTLIPYGWYEVDEKGSMMFLHIYVIIISKTIFVTKLKCFNEKLKNSMKEQFRDVLRGSQDTKRFDLWKDQLGSHLNCNRNDMKCWTNLLPRLACQIDDTHCWKKKLPHVPCEQNDSECWRHLLPHLPCKVDDHKCWDEIKSGYVLRDIHHNQDKIINIPPKADGFNPMRNLQRQYGGMVSSQNHVWIT